MEKKKKNEINYPAHILFDCIFSARELSKLQKIKGNPSWKPREERQGSRELWRHLKKKLED